MNLGTSESLRSLGDGSSPDTDTNHNHPGSKKIIKDFLDNLQEGRQLTNNAEEVTSDVSLNLLSYQDFPALRQACTKLNIKGNDPKVNVVFQARITAMVGAINLYLDPRLPYTW